MFWKTGAAAWQGAGAPFFVERFGCFLNSLIFETGSYCKKPGELHFRVLRAFDTKWKSVRRANMAERSKIFFHFFAFHQLSWIGKYVARRNSGGSQQGRAFRKAVYFDGDVVVHQRIDTGADFFTHNF